MNTPQADEVRQLVQAQADETAGLKAMLLDVKRSVDRLLNMTGQS